MKIPTKDYSDYQVGDLITEITTYSYKGDLYEKWYISNKKYTK